MNETVLSLVEAVEAFLEKDETTNIIDLRECGCERCVRVEGIINELKNVRVLLGKANNG